MEIRLLIHLDEGPTWWAESDDVPGFNASASSLAELRKRCMASLIEIVPDLGIVTECLVGESDDVATDNPSPGSSVDGDRSVGAPARTVLVAS